jgi:CNT family concentrative nucleoside transporter
MTIYNWISVAGLFIFMGMAWLFSAHRRVVNWRAIGWGLLLQIIFGFFVFVVPVGRDLFLLLNKIVTRILSCASAGTEFLFGPLALPPGTPGSVGFILAIQALPTIIFFASFMAVLYYIGIMPWIIRLFAVVFTRLMRISGAESLVTASNIFVGVESATTIRPYLREMTRSELCVVLTAGMATIASSVMAFYVYILQKDFPTIAGHLMSASILSAPAAILMSKLIMPETETPVTLGQNIKPCYERESSVTEAVINGANAGLKLVGGVIALLMAFLGLMAVLDLLTTGLGGKLNLLAGLHIDWSLKGLLGYLFYPFTLAMGVPDADAWQISRIIGERVVVTEAKAYQDLAALISSGTLVCPNRSALITVYALCGFAHVASLAIFIGGTAALAPERTKDLATVGVRALFAATLACLMTACIAGVFYAEGLTPILKSTPTSDLLRVEHPSTPPIDCLGSDVRRFTITVPKGHCLSMKEFVFRQGTLSPGESKDSIWFSRDRDQCLQKDFMLANPNRSLFAATSNTNLIVRLPSGTELGIDPNDYVRSQTFSDPTARLDAKGNDVGVLSFMLLSPRQTFADPFSLNDIAKSKLTVLVYLSIYPPDAKDPRYGKYYENEKAEVVESFASPFPLLKKDIQRLAKPKTALSGLIPFTRNQK